ncbi:hypothetical protein HD806DRAFT_526746 [Xylariaceae sp. AK1471]|nr:hypothetical protein HD806DRAFT_526746 [Xylariaceae sp. AK1471]
MPSLHPIGYRSRLLVFTLPKKLIALEKHSALTSLGAGESIPLYADALATFLAAATKLFDLGAVRLHDVDISGISDPAGCCGANDELAAAVCAHPSRFAAFGIFPMAFPDAAATKLERAVTEPGCVGTLVYARLLNSTHYDATKYWPVFAAAERLCVPLDPHPAAPPSPNEIATRYGGNHLPRAEYFVLGHNGEMVPTMLDRASATLCKFGDGGPKRGLREVWDENVWSELLTQEGLEDFAWRNAERLLGIVA